MLNVQDYVVIKVVSPTGKRLGATLSKQGFPDIYVASKDMCKLASHLRQTGQTLLNSSLSVDGRLLTRKSKKIQQKVVDERVFKQKAKTFEQVQPKPTSTPVTTALKELDAKLGKPNPVASTTKVKRKEKESVYKDTLDLLKSNGLQGTKTELRVGYIVEAGLRLARENGLSSCVTSISVATPDCSSSYKVYMTVSAYLLKQVYGHRVGMKFLVRMNGTATLYLYLQDLNVGDACCTPNDFLDEDERVTVGCKTARDICNVLCWYVATQKGRLNATGGDVDTPDPYRPSAELNRYVSLLLVETRNDEATNYGRRYDAPVYPHAIIRADLRDHIRSLEQVRQALNEKYLGSYSFVWQMSVHEAVLSASRYIYPEKDLAKPHRYRGDVRLAQLIGDYSISTDTLADVKLNLKQMLNGYGVTISHRVHDVLNTGKWVTLDEHRNLTWLDSVCESVGAVLDEIFQLGSIRGTLRVIACGELNDRHCYLLQGYETPVTKEELLELRKYTLIDGIRFDLNENNQIDILYDTDCLGEPLNRFGDVRGERFIRQVYRFRDEITDTQLMFKTAVSLGAYMKLHKLERKESLHLSKPKTYIKGLFVLPETQLNTLRHLSEQLKKHMIEHEYTQVKAVELLLNFMRCFKYSRLSDLTLGNKTPLETLVERHGCCLELSLLACVLADLLGFDAALLIRYSPDLATKYHAVSSVKLRGFQPDVLCYDELSSVVVCNYVGLEHTSNTHGKIGVANSWCNKEFGFIPRSYEDLGDCAVSLDIGALAASSEATQLAKARDNGIDDYTKTATNCKISQIVVVPIGVEFQIGVVQALLYEKQEQRLIPLKAPHWLKISSWFSRNETYAVSSNEQARKAFPPKPLNVWDTL